MENQEPIQPFMFYPSLIRDHGLNLKQSITLSYFINEFNNDLDPKYIRVPFSLEQAVLDTQLSKLDIWYSIYTLREKNLIYTDMFGYRIMNNNILNIPNILDAKW